MQLAPDVSVDWHDAVDLIEQLLDRGFDSDLAARLRPLLQAGELLDRWAEPWVARERDRYHAMRMAAIDVLARDSDEPLARCACGSGSLCSVAANGDSGEPGAS